VREIKFRAWRTDGKYMVTSDVGALTALRNCYGNKGLAEQAGFSNIDNQPNPDKFILMQYTGLKDKNGKDIYEGDICKNDGGMIGEIVFNEFAWMFRWKSGNYYPFGQWCEVIGNIYENPELLK
jgi:uncharacterized phage protein (TIGR01671 family)